MVTHMVPVQTTEVAPHAGIEVDAVEPFTSFPSAARNVMAAADPFLIVNIRPTGMGRVCVIGGRNDPAVTTTISSSWVRVAPPATTLTVRVDMVDMTRPAIPSEWTSIFLVVP
ncbi:hypothetical protein [Paeniglutamicibacter antarcticus]|uniref:hypothetical protein n=1 Tax=Paeniglutamicibacter antarcticus TaxID=494023 RepID=UPI001AE52792